MSKYFESVLARCPFYQGEYKREIVCEAPLPGSNVHLGFSTKAVRDEHKRVFCYAWAYEECPLYRSLEEYFIKREPDDESSPPYQGATERVRDGENPAALI